MKKAWKSSVGVFLTLLLSFSGCSQPDSPAYHTVTLWASDGSLIRRWQGSDFHVSIKDNGTLVIRAKNGERTEVRGTYTHERTFGRSALTPEDEKLSREIYPEVKSGFAKWKEEKERENIRHKQSKTRNCPGMKPGSIGVKHGVCY